MTVKKKDQVDTMDARWMLHDVIYAACKAALDHWAEPFEVKDTVNLAMYRACVGKMKEDSNEHIHTKA